MQMMLVSIGNFMLNISMQCKPLNPNPNNETLNDTPAPLGIYRFQKNKTVLRAEHEFALAKKRGEEMEVEAAMEKERAMQGANATLNTPS